MAIFKAPEGLNQLWIAMGHTCKAGQEGWRTSLPEEGVLMADGRVPGGGREPMANERTCSLAAGALAQETSSLQSHGLDVDLGDRATRPRLPRSALSRIRDLNRSFQPACWRNPESSRKLGDPAGPAVARCPRPERRQSLPRLSFDLHSNHRGDGQLSGARNGRRPADLALAPYPGPAGPADLNLPRNDDSQHDSLIERCPAAWNRMGPVPRGWIPPWGGDDLSVQNQLPSKRPCRCWPPTAQAGRLKLRPGLIVHLPPRQSLDLPRQADGPAGACLPSPAAATVYFHQALAASSPRRPPLPTHRTRINARPGGHRDHRSGRVHQRGGLRGEGQLPQPQPSNTLATQGAGQRR